jgi:hypothetical protein
VYCTIYWALAQDGWFYLKITDFMIKSQFNKSITITKMRPVSNQSEFNKLFTSVEQQSLENLLIENGLRPILEAAPDYLAYVYKIFSLYGVYGFPSLDRVKGINPKLQADIGITVLHPLSMLSLDIYISSLLWFRESLRFNRIINNNQTIIPPQFLTNNILKHLSITSRQGSPFIFSHIIRDFIQTVEGQSFIKKEINYLNGLEIYNAQGEKGILHARGEILQPDEFRVSQSIVSLYENSFGQEGLEFASLHSLGGKLESANASHWDLLNKPSLQSILRLRGIDDIEQLRVIHDATHL